MRMADIVQLPRSRERDIPRTMSFESSHELTVYTPRRVDVEEVNIQKVERRVN